MFEKLDIYISGIQKKNIYQEEYDIKFNFAMYGIVSMMLIYMEIFYTYKVFIDILNKIKHKLKKILFFTT